MSRRPAPDSWTPATLTLAEGGSAILSAGDELVFELRQLSPAPGVTRCELRISESALVAYFARVRGGREA